MKTRSADGAIDVVINTGTAAYIMRLPLKEAEDFHAVLGQDISKAKSDRRAGYKVAGEPDYVRVRRRTLKQE